MQISIKIGLYFDLCKHKLLAINNSQKFEIKKITYSCKLFCSYCLVVLTQFQLFSYLTEFCPESLFVSNDLSLHTSITL